MNKWALGLVAIIAGIIVLVFPAIIQWIIGIFLIVYGILMLLGKR
jgi:uncharacterized membrane protein HdeD (DUF308 family)